MQLNTMQLCMLELGRGEDAHVHTYLCILYYEMLFVGWHFLTLFHQDTCAFGLGSNE